MTSALPCPAGRYQDLAGQSSCKPCTAGSFCSTAGLTQPDGSCPVGSFSSSAASSPSCAPCPAGQIQPLTGQSSCTLCTLGTYNPSVGASVCVSCPANTICLAGAAKPTDPQAEPLLSGGYIAGITVASIAVVAVAVVLIKKCYRPAISNQRPDPNVCPIDQYTYPQLVRAHARARLANNVQYSPPPVPPRHPLNPKAVMTLYHSTSLENATQIMKCGFLCGSNGIAGGGIYFAESQADADRKAHRHGAMFECKVEIGRQLEIQHQGDRLAQQKMIDGSYDSVKVLRNGNEHVIYNPEQVKSKVWLNISG